MPLQQPCRHAMFVGIVEHWREGWRPNARAVKRVVALGAGIGTSLHCVWCCRTARSRRATLALELFFLSLVGPGGAMCAALPCPWLRLYVPSQVPLSLHTRSKKAPVLRRGKKSNVVSLLCPALSDIFLNVGQQLCELCAVRVVRPCFVWMPVHSRQVFRLAFFRLLFLRLVAAGCMFSHSRLSPSLYLVCLCIFSPFLADVLNTCSELLFICSSSF